MSSSAGQSLASVVVPWRIDPATPYLRLSASESTSDSPTQVKFVAHFGLGDSAASEWDQKSAQQFYPPYDSNRKLEKANTAYQVVKVTFAGALCVRMLPSFSDGHIVDPGIYDSSGVPPSEEGLSVEQWMRSFNEMWVKNRICPDPHMYEVQHSLWLREAGVEGQGFKHFLLLGHDAYIEVIAKNWKWESEGALPELLSKNPSSS